MVSCDFSPNVEVHLRRTLCDVRWNVLLAPIFIGCSWLRLPNHSRAVVVIPSQWAKVHCARGGHIYSGANVEVHLRCTLCDVRCNALFAHILLAVWLLTPKIQFFLFLPPNQAASAARRHLHIFCANVSVHPRRTLCAVVVERFVGIFFLAVHALALSEIVAASSMLFARGWWRVHFTCGSPLF